MDFVDKLGAAILPVVSLENEYLTKRSPDSFQVYACLDPNETCLTVDVLEDSPSPTGIVGGHKTDQSNPETKVGPS